MIQQLTKTTHHCQKETNCSLISRTARTHAHSSAHQTAGAAMHCQSDTLGSWGWRSSPGVSPMLSSASFVHFFMFSAVWRWRWWRRGGGGTGGRAHQVLALPQIKYKTEEECGGVSMNTNTLTLQWWHGSTLVAPPRLHRLSACSPGWGSHCRYSTTSMLRKLPFLASCLVF